MFSIPRAFHYADLSLLLLRLMVALVFRSSGSIYMKVFKWKIGFWGEKTYGWYYHLLFVVMNLTILATGEGRIALLPT